MVTMISNDDGVQSAEYEATSAGNATQPLRLRAVKHSRLEWSEKGTRIAYSKASTSGWNAWNVHMLLSAGSLESDDTLMDLVKHAQSVV